MRRGNYLVASYLIADIAERISRFRREMVSLGGEVVLLPNLIAVGTYIIDLAMTLKARRIALSKKLPRKLFPADIGKGRFDVADQFRLSREQFFDALKTAEIGVSSADLAVAETGTLVMATSDEMERLVTALPRTHVAILPYDRLVNSLAEAGTFVTGILNDSSARGSISLISGISSTSDIGGLVVRGVHGPRFLHVCLLDRQSLEAI